jgi:hypothetical protein
MKSEMKKTLPTNGFSHKARTSNNCIWDCCCQRLFVSLTEFESFLDLASMQSRLTMAQQLISQFPRVLDEQQAPSDELIATLIQDNKMLKQKMATYRTVELSSRINQGDMTDSSDDHVSTVL